MSRREGIALLIFVLVAVGFVVFYTNRTRTEDAGAVGVMASRAISVPEIAALPPTPRIVASDARLIEQGQFYISAFDLRRPGTVTVSVSLKSGAAIDSYFVAEQGLNAWKAMAANNQSISFPYRPALTMAPLDGDYTRSAHLEPGTYALIIDNSRLGATSPPVHFFKRTSALVRFAIQVSN